MEEVSSRENVDRERIFRLLNEMLARHFEIELFNYAKQAFLWVHVCASVLT